MIVHIDKLRERIARGERCLGAGISFSDPAITEALGPSVDFLWLDLEHTPMGLESLQAHLIAARATGTPALVRVPGPDVNWIKRVLDTGAEGLIVPQIRTVEEVRMAVEASRYPPLGRRGYGPRRPSDYGRNAGPEYVQAANQLLYLVIQIETAEAVESLQEILAVPGFDAIVLGPQDLSGSLGLLGQIRHPTVVESIRHVVRAARAAGKHVGIGMGPDADYATEAAALGVHWIQCGGDFSYLVGGCESLFGQIRSRLAQR